MKYSTALQNYRYMALHNIALQYVTNTSLITLNCTINFNTKVTIPKKKKNRKYLGSTQPWMKRQLYLEESDFFYNPIIIV